MSFWNKFVTFFKTSYAKASAGFVAVFGQDAANEFAHGAEALLQTALGKIAVDAVTAVSSLTRNADGTPVTPTSKQAAAFKQILTDAKTQGITISASVANMLIELAVQKVVTQNVIPK